MKKKGFTLIELLVVIAILAVILLIAVPIVIGNIDKSKSKSYDNQVALFKEGAKRLALEYDKDLVWEDTEVKGVQKTTITLRELAEKDYVDLPVTNPKIGEPFDPDTTLITIYKDKDGNYTFEYEDPTTDQSELKLIVGSKVQTIIKSIAYDDKMIMADVYGSDNGKDITDKITYTCKYNQESIDCNTLSSSTKEIGTYYITYSLTNGKETKTDIRTLKVLEASRPIIEVRPEDDGVTKVPSVRVTIIYPEGSKSRTYGTKYETNKTYVMSFDINENQIITADCIDKNGLKCETATKPIRHIQVTPPTITVNYQPTSAVNNYYKQGVARVVFREKAVKEEQYFIRTTKVGTSSVAVTEACGTGSTPNISCTTIPSTNVLNENTWYKVSEKVNVTYNQTSTSVGNIEAVIWASTVFGEVVTKNIERIDVSGPTIAFGEPTIRTDSISVPITVRDNESGLNGTPTCSGGTVTGSGTSYTCTMSGLTQTTRKEYEVCISDRLGNNSCAKGGQTTATITNPRVTMQGYNKSGTAIGPQNGYVYLTKATVTFSNAAITSASYYVKSSIAATSTISGTQCGTGNLPGTCSGGETTSFVANTWYKVSGTTVLTLNGQGDVYAYTYDATGNKGYGTGTSVKQDITPPTIAYNYPVQSNVNWYGGEQYMGCFNGGITPTLTLTDTESGVSSSSNIAIWKDGTWINNAQAQGNNKWNIPMAAEGRYIPHIVAVDNVGNQTSGTRSDGNHLTVWDIDTSAPTITNVNLNGYTSGAWTNSNVTITLSATNSGCESTINYYYSINDGAWVQFNGTYTETNGANYNIKFKVTDGWGRTGTQTGNYQIKIDKTAPTITTGNITVRTDSISIPITVSESGAGIASVTCKYGASYGSTGAVSGSGSSYTCTISGVAQSTTQNYQICSTDKAGNNRCVTGGGTTATITNSSIAWQGYNKSGTAIGSQNGYVYTDKATVTFNSANITTASYYIKTNVATTSTVSGTPCGTGTTPGGCSGTATTSLSANTWYKVTSNPTLTFNSQGDVYAYTYDASGNNKYNSGSSRGIDRTAPSISLGTVSSTTNSISASATISDGAGLSGTPTCSGGTVSGSYPSYTCTISGLSQTTTQSYQICASDKLGNSNCATYSTTTKTITNPKITWQGYNKSGTAIGSQNGYVYTDKATVTFSNANITTASYYVKTTVATTSTVSGVACGIGNTPGTCSGSGSTTFIANAWYKVTSSPTLTFNSQGDVYAYTYDASSNNKYSSGTSRKIDRTAPTLTLGTVTSDATSIEITATVTENESLGRGMTFNYGTISGNYPYSASSVTSPSANQYYLTLKYTITGLTSNKTYYYKICPSADNVGNTASCKTGSVTTKDPITTCQNEVASLAAGGYQDCTGKTGADLAACQGNNQGKYTNVKSKYDQCCKESTGSETCGVTCSSGYSLKFDISPVGYTCVKETSGGSTGGSSDTSSCSATFEGSSCGTPPSCASSLMSSTTHCQTYCDGTFYSETWSSSCVSCPSGKTQTTRVYTECQYNRN